MNLSGKFIYTKQLYQIGYKLSIVFVAPIKHGRNNFVVIEKFKQYIFVRYRQKVPVNISAASLLAAVYLVKPPFVFAAGFFCVFFESTF